jgi:hypothetical protein
MCQDRCLEISLMAALFVSGSQVDRASSRGQLANDLFADALIAAGHKSDFVCHL